MLIKEYRIVMPMSMEEYKIGQLFSVAEASLHETGGGEGVEVIANEPFKNVALRPGSLYSGQYTHKIYHVASRFPSYIRLFIPTGAMLIHEEAWNAYPYCRTVITNPDYMEEKFTLTIETIHCPDRGGQENVHKLSHGMLKQREVVMIDIANDQMTEADYNPEEDPANFTSEKTGRGPLTGNWIAECNPVMTCYKLVKAEFKWFGFQNRVETVIHKSERRIFTKFHRQVFCWIDRWQAMSMEDIREMEERVQRSLDDVSQSTGKSDDSTRVHLTIG